MLFESSYSQNKKGSIKLHTEYFDFRCKTQLDPPPVLAILRLDFMLATGAVRCCMSANKHLRSESGRAPSSNEGGNACNEVEWMELYMGVVTRWSRGAQKSHGYFARTPHSLYLLGTELDNFELFSPLSRD